MLTKEALPGVPGPLLLTPVVHRDDRGFFVETYNASQLAAAGIAATFVQDNLSLSHRPGTIRGLHFQSPPMAQGKLVRVQRGAVLDVVVDLRRGSPTYGRHIAVTLSAETMQELWVPPGFAHGFCTLVPDTEVAYKVTNHYSAPHDSGLAWNDPALGITWPIDEQRAILSEKDRRLPRLAELVSPFRYEP